MASLTKFVNAVRLGPFYRLTRKFMREASRSKLDITDKKNLGELKHRLGLDGFKYRRNSLGVSPWDGESPASSSC